MGAHLGEHVAWSNKNLNKQVETTLTHQFNDDITSQGWNVFMCSLF